jgi:hypothetical protein
VATLKKTTVHLFDFIKRKQEMDFSPEQTMRRLIEYMPEFYKTHRQYINCVDFLEHREWELALDSLIELADETGHYFSEDYWIGLADSAEKMKLSKKSNYCRQQIKRNENDIKSKIPFGWTTIKIDSNHFQSHISEKLKDEWATKRRDKDQVLSLIDKDGVHLKSHGRTGFIYVVDNGKIAEIEFELGVKGLILYFSNMTNWELPTRLLLTTEEKLNIRNKISNWSTTTGNAIEFDD